MFYFEEHLLVDELAEGGDAVEQVFVDVFPLEQLFRFGQFETAVEV